MNYAVRLEQRPKFSKASADDLASCVIRASWRLCHWQGLLPAKLRVPRKVLLSPSILGMSHAHVQTGCVFVPTLLVSRSKRSSQPLEPCTRSDSSADGTEASRFRAKSLQFRACKLQQLINLPVLDDLVNDLKIEARISMA
jgi:hypothetical protein